MRELSVPRFPAVEVVAMRLTDEQLDALDMEVREGSFSDKSIAAYNAIDALIAEVRRGRDVAATARKVLPGVMYHVQRVASGREAEKEAEAFRDAIKAFEEL